jgi:hypothetical protein
LDGFLGPGTQTLVCGWLTIFAASSLERAIAGIRYEVFTLPTNRLAGKQTFLLFAHLILEARGLIQSIRQGHSSHDKTMVDTSPPTPDMRFLGFGRMSNLVSSQLFSSSWSTDP